MAALKNDWTLPEAGYRKFISSAMAYALSKSLSRKKFEVVHEGYLDLHNPGSDAPDVIVYEAENNNEPVLMIELCFDANEKDILRTVGIIREIYNVKEAFVFNIESDYWTNCSSAHVTKGSYSELFNIDLGILLKNNLARFQSLT